MRIAYFDCLSGISGDMTLGALIDAGASLDTVLQGVRSLGLGDLNIRTDEVHKCGFRALQVTIEHPPEHAHRHLHHIEAMIDGADAVTPRAKQLAKQIFQVLGAAEAKVHGTTMQKVHFHEVGAVDSIADIVGTAIALDDLAIEAIEASPVPTGTGEITIAHGRVSIPAPATAELLIGIPLAASAVLAELTTPTGAAILRALAQRFGSLPAMIPDAIGYGAGQRDIETQANLLRVLIGEVEPSGSSRHPLRAENQVGLANPEPTALAAGTSHASNHPETPEASAHGSENPGLPLAHAQIASNHSSQRPLGGEGQGDRSNHFPRPLGGEGQGDRSDHFPRPLGGEGQGDRSDHFPRPLGGEGQGDRSDHFPRPLGGEGQGEGVHCMPPLYEHDQVIALETNIDNTTAEDLAYCAERLTEAGALDVYQTPCLMKKGRAGTQLTVLCPPARAAQLQRLLLQNTGTIGIRRQRLTRTKLPRRQATIETEFGPVQGKESLRPDGHWDFAVEYEDAARLAREQNIPLHQIRTAARRATENKQASQ